MTFDIAAVCVSLTLSFCAMRELISNIINLPECSCGRGIKILETLEATIKNVGLNIIVNSDDAILVDPKQSIQYRIVYE